MRVLSLSTSLSNGGAALTAANIAMSLSHYVDMLHVTQDGTLGSLPTPPNLTPSRSPRLKRVIARLPRFFDTCNRGVYKSYSFLPSNILSIVNAVQPDLIHLHWVQGEFISIREIGKLTQPIVWTLHDSWPFSGSEHHQLPLDNLSFQDGYSSSPWYSPCRLTFNRKQRAWRGLPIFAVAPSQWILERALSSQLFRDAVCTRIQNPVSFSYQSCLEPLFRKPKNSIAILVGSLTNTYDPIKGIDLFLDSLAQLRALTNLDIYLLSVGRLSDLGIPGINTISLGYLPDPDSMSSAYISADVTCIPSRIETHSQMAAESICAGTPVVAFDVAGNPSIVTHGSTGLLVSPYDTSQLAESLLECLRLFPEKLPNETVHAAKKFWSPELVAHRYLDLYNKALSTS